MYLYLLHPILYILKSLTFIDCIGQNDAHGTSVVGLCDCFKLLLASCVPDLKSYYLIGNKYGFDFEVDADGSEMGGHEVVITEFE
jgi:hypothetical protein